MSGTKIRGYGLYDLIKNQIPTYAGWDTDPTDGSHLTDHDMTTLFETGSKAIDPGFQYGFILFDLGAVYHFILYGWGGVVSTAGTRSVYLHVKDPITDVYQDWGQLTVSGSDLIKPFKSVAISGRYIRLGFTASLAATISPLCRGLYVRRLD